MITLLRHAESVNNRYHRDDLNPPLTAKGKLQANKLNGFYDYILISPMARTKETFEYSNLTGDVIEYSSLCRGRIGTEYHLGNIMEGESNLVETNADFNFRMNLLKMYIKEKSKFYNILIITHRAVIKSLTNQYVDNASFINF